MALQVHSIFQSISGEAGPVFPQGVWCTFIRLQGCNLRCSYCDTKEAQGKGGTKMEIEDILHTVLTMHATPNVLITGGEPLLQGEECRRLIQRLSALHHRVQIETNGCFVPVTKGSQRNIGYAIDVKCPSSGVCATSENNGAPATPDELISGLQSVDFPLVDLKFIVSTKEDVRFTIPFINALVDKCPQAVQKFIVSPVFMLVEKQQALSGIWVSDLFHSLNEAARERTCVSVQIHKIFQVP